RRAAREPPAARRRRRAVARAHAAASARGPVHLAGAAGRGRPSTRRPGAARPHRRHRVDRVGRAVARRGGRAAGPAGRGPGPRGAGGDLAQRRSVAGARSWAAALDRYAPGRWTHRALTVGYRTPAEIMAVAADVLAAHDPGCTTPEAARSTGVRPWARRVSPDELVDAVRLE